MNTTRHRTRRRRQLAIEPLEERALLSLLGQQLFPNDNPWNQRVDAAPVAANSSAIMSAIIGSNDGRLHPDFGQDYHDGRSLYGIPYNVVHGNAVPKTLVVIDAYPDESDLQQAPIPAAAVLEGDLQDAPTIGVDNRGDSHLIVWDQDHNVAYEFYRASRPSENSDGQWHADAEAVWDMATNTFRPLGWTSVDAAGLAILPGLVRPDEGLPASEGGQGTIQHAVRFTLRNSVILDQFLYPASHTANPGNHNPAVQPPMGARFRLKAGVDISALNPESKIVAQALKEYGLIVADNGSNFFISGASYSVDASNHVALTWNDDDIQDTRHGLKSLTFSDFEVVDLTPAVTGLSPRSGADGTQVAITGRNFSGAAGHLQVFFGGVAASAVTLLDDAHLVAVAPAGAGTVEVRVQSGVSDPQDEANINSPIFGYGLSAPSAAGQFTLQEVVARVWHNAANPGDVDGRDGVTPLDVLTLISYLNAQTGSSALPAAPASPPPYYDVAGDDRATPLDVLVVINYLNAHAAGAAEGEMNPAAPTGSTPRPAEWSDERPSAVSRPVSWSPRADSRVTLPARLPARLLSHPGLSRRMRRQPAARICLMPASDSLTHSMGETPGK